MNESFTYKEISRLICLLFILCMFVLLRCWRIKNEYYTIFCCCTASMEQAIDGAETAAIDGLVSS